MTYVFWLIRNDKIVEKRQTHGRLNICVKRSVYHISNQLKNPSSDHVYLFVRKETSYRGFRGIG